MPNIAAGDLADYMGLPIMQTEEFSVSALPFRAYARIWNEWFRDENLQEAVSSPTGDGPDPDPTAQGMKIPLARNKSHDYFTSALPWPQKFTAPAVPVGGLAPVRGLGVEGVNPSFHPNSTIQVAESDGTLVTYPFLRDVGQDPGSDVINRLVVAGDGSGAAALPQIFADLADATGMSINDFRRTFAIQALLERDARGGTRYIELLKSHFGVSSPDARLQRPEYIGGGHSALNVTPVAQTAPTAGQPVGALGAAATASGEHSASFASTEHGVIIGLISVRSELGYQQGIQRSWSRKTRFDFYWPSLAGLGEQAILNQELFFDSADAVWNAGVFGYQERWHEYRQRYSEVTGLFRSTATGAIDQWHLAQELDYPELSLGFVVDAPPMARVLAAGALAAGQQYLADILIQRTAVRPVPMFGTPVTLGRF